jgi:hypothetical protein
LDVAFVVNAWEKPDERCPANFVERHRGPAALGERVPVHPKDMVHPSDTQAVSRQHEFGLWVLAKLHAFVHRFDYLRLPS